MSKLEIVLHDVFVLCIRPTNTGPLIEYKLKTNFMNKILLTLLAGVAIGLLIAPGKGSETWRRVVDGLDDYKDKVSDEANDIYVAGMDAVKKGKSKVER
jgi:hypothetical protein